MTSNLSGKLLIASPYLTDGNFLRSVVFMIRHDPEGAFGLAINRPTTTRFREVAGVTGMKGQARDDDWIHRGGPVEGPLLALHDLAGVGEPCVPFSDQGPAELASPGPQFILHDHPEEAWGSMSIELDHPPVWITGDDDHLRVLLHRPDAKLRYIAHYSGWGPNQLDEELRVGGWLVGNADPEVLFGDADMAWETAVRRCGHEILKEIVPGIRSGNSERN